MSERGETIVIGAGVIGAACALQLQRDGHAVRLIDRELPGTGASFGNAGSLSTGSVVPVALPGMVQQVPGWLFDPQGPLAVRWSYLPRALPWLIGWLRASRAAQAKAIASSLATLTLTAVDDWKNFVEPEQRDRLLRQNGQLLVSRTSQAGATELFAQALREANGVKAEAVEAAELRQLEPALAPDYRRGIFIPDSGHTTNPRALTEALVQLFQAAGGIFMRGDVTRIEQRDGQASAVHTGGGSLPATRVVVASGAFSLTLAKPLGDKAPLDTERGYHCVLPRAGLEINRPTSDMDRKFFVSSMEEGLRVAGTVEIAGLRRAPDYRRAHMLARQAKEMLPKVESVEHTVWMGHRPSLPDSMPVIDRSKRVRNVWYAFGHGHIGLTTAPATARLISRMVNSPDGRLEDNAFRIDRF